MTEGHAAIGSRAWRAPAAVNARQRRLLDLRAQQYTQTKNPVYLWAAIGEARAMGLPDPPWVTAYLVRVADEIGALQRAAVPKRKALPRAIYRALEFDQRAGTANPLAARRTTFHDVGVAQEMWYLLGDGLGETDAKYLVASAHPTNCTATPKCGRISEAQVLRLWRKYRASLPPVVIIAD